MTGDRKDRASGIDALLVNFMSRRQSREQAFILIFEKIFNPDATLDELASAARETELFEADDFTLSLCRAAFDNTDAIDAVIARFARGWTLQRLPKVSLAVLRLALAELEYTEDIPQSVTVNEAVELVKKFGAQDSASFVNGLLGSFIRSKETVEQ